MLDLVRFKCGCVGTRPLDGKSHVIDPCDGEASDYGFLRLTLRSDLKDIGDFRPLGEAEYGKYVLALSTLLSDGARFRELKSLLR